MAVTTEVGRLRTVLLHRPGDELRRLTPRNSADLLFDGIPWVERAQAEHDAFVLALQAHGVEVLQLVDLLIESLAVPAARSELIAAAVPEQLVGPVLAARLQAQLVDLPAADLAEILVAGRTAAELECANRPGGSAGTDGLVATLAGPHDFIVAPLPNLLFTRDSSLWIGDHVVVTRPSLRARRREASLTGAVYRHHPRFAGVPHLLEPADTAGLEGGDVLLLAPGVIAIGVGQRTSSAGAEVLASRVFAAGLAHAVLVVPISQDRATIHLDTVCTMVDVDAVVMYPAVADTLRAWTVTPTGVTGPRPFITAAADAIGLDRLRVIDTGLDPITAEREQWDDGNNTLALAPGIVVAYERNTVTNDRLVAAGIEVVAIAGSELGSGRGGPRCMSCPIDRAPLDAGSPK